MFEENNDGFIFLVPPFPWSRNPNSVQLYILDIKQYVNNINNLMSNYLIINDNCGIISKDYREQLINIKTSGKYGIYPPKEMGEITVSYLFGKPTENGIYAKIGPASCLFMDFLRFDDAYMDKCLEKITKKLIKREIDGDPIKSIIWGDEAYRPSTIKIFNLNEKDVESAERSSNNIINICFFKFAQQKRINLDLVKSYKSPMRERPLIDPSDFMPPITGNQIDLPSGEYNEDLVQIYKRGIIAEDPFIQFLSFYQILEYYYIPNINDKIYKSISKIVTGAGTNKQEQVANEIDRYNKKDKIMIRQLLNEVVEPDELIKFIDSYQKHLKVDIYTKNFNILGSTSISTDPHFVIGHTANRIYQIRNALVHFSDDQEGKEKYVPTVNNEKTLRQEVPLVQFLAEKAITSDILKNFSYNNTGGCVSSSKLKKFE